MKGIVTVLLMCLLTVGCGDTIPEQAKIYPSDQSDLVGEWSNDEQGIILMLHEASLVEETYYRRVSLVYIDTDNAYDGLIEVTEYNDDTGYNFRPSGILPKPDALYLRRAVLFPERTLHNVFVEWCYPPKPRLPYPRVIPVVTIPCIEHNHVFAPRDALMVSTQGMHGMYMDWNEFRWKLHHYRLAISENGLVCSMSVNDYQFGSHSYTDDGCTVSLFYRWRQNGSWLHFEKDGDPSYVTPTRFELDGDTLSLAWRGEWTTFRRK
jgi:hypothetical protein